MNDFPPNWFWQTEPGFDRPVAIYDMDGVLADALHRQRFLRVDPPDWESFNARSAFDEHLPDGVAALRASAETAMIVVLTARPVRVHEHTAEWLAARDLPVSLLILRPDHDERQSPELKRDELAALRAAGAEVVLGVDDHPGVIEMYEAHGVPTRLVHSGYYDIGEV